MMDEVGRAGKNRAVTGGGLGRDSENGGSQVGRGFFVVVALGGGQFGVFASSSRWYNDCFVEDRTEIGGRRWLRYHNNYYRWCPDYGPLGQGTDR